MEFFGTGYSPAELAVRRRPPVGDLLAGRVRGRPFRHSIRPPGSGTQAFSLIRMPVSGLLSGKTPWTLSLFMIACQDATHRCPTAEFRHRPALARMHARPINITTMQIRRFLAVFPVASLPTGATRTPPPEPLAPPSAR